MNTRRKCITELRTMFRASIAEHKASLDPNHPRDFIDVYLLEMMTGTNPNFDMESLEITCLDLFKAGAETSSTTILWIILFLVRYQEVQEKCFMEISREVGMTKNQGLWPSLRGPHLKSAMKAMAGFGIEAGVL